MMQLRAPTDGIVNVLPNFRSQGTFGQTPPPFKEGDNVWTGAADRRDPGPFRDVRGSQLEEVDRGKLQTGPGRAGARGRHPGQGIRRLNSTWISPIAALVYKGGSTPEKTFPARATLKNLDDRLRPGMSSSAEIIIERQPNQLLIPIRASFDKDGKPAVYVQIGKQFVVRPIQVGRRNDDDIIVTGGLKEGEMVTLESPADAAKRAKKKL